MADLRVLRSCCEARNMGMRKRIFLAASYSNAAFRQTHLSRHPDYREICRLFIKGLEISTPLIPQCVHLLL